MTPADILRKAKAHISDPDMWWKGGGFAKREEVDLTSIDAAKRGQPCCAVGAIEWVDPVISDYFVAERLLTEAVREKHKKLYVTVFNDDPTTTHADVMAVFDRAIELAEANQ